MIWQGPRRPRRWLYGLLLFLVVWLPLLWAVWRFGGAIYASMDFDGSVYDLWISLYTVLVRDWVYFLFPAVTGLVFSPVLLGLRGADYRMDRLFYSLDGEGQDQYMDDIGKVRKHRGFYCGELGLWYTMLTPRAFGFVVIPWNDLAEVRADGKGKSTLLLRTMDGGEERCRVLLRKDGVDGCLDELRKQAAWCLDGGRPVPDPPEPEHLSWKQRLFPPRHPGRWLYRAALLLVFWAPLLYAAQHMVLAVYDEFMLTEEFWPALYTAFAGGWRLFLIAPAATALTSPLLLGLRRSDGVTRGLFRSLDRHWQEVYVRDHRKVLRNGGFYCGELGLWVTLCSPRFTGFIVVPWQLLLEVRREKDTGKLWLRHSGGEFLYRAALSTAGVEGCLKQLREKAPWCLGDGHPPWQDILFAESGVQSHLPKQRDSKATRKLRRRFTLLFGWQYPLAWTLLYGVPALFAAFTYARSVSALDYAFGLSFFYAFMEHWMLLVIPLTMWLLFGWFTRGLHRRRELLGDLFWSLDPRWQELFLQDGRQLGKQRGFYCGQVGVWFFSLTIGWEGLAGAVPIPYQNLHTVIRKRGRLDLYDVSGRRYRYRGFIPLKTVGSAEELLEEHAPWCLHTPADDALIDAMDTQPIGDLPLADDAGDGLPGGDGADGGAPEVLEDGFNAPGGDDGGAPDEGEDVRIDGDDGDSPSDGDGPGGDGQDAEPTEDAPSGEDPTASERDGEPEGDAQSDDGNASADGQDAGNTEDVPSGGQDDGPYGDAATAGNAPVSEQDGEPEGDAQSDDGNASADGQDAGDAEDAPADRDAPSGGQDDGPDGDAAVAGNAPVREQDDEPEGDAQSDHGDNSADGQDAGSTEDAPSGGDVPSGGQDDDPDGDAAVIEQDDAPEGDAQSDHGDDSADGQGTENAEDPPPGEQDEGSDGDTPPGGQDGKTEDDVLPAAPQADDSQPAAAAAPADSGKRNH